MLGRYREGLENVNIAKIRRLLYQAERLLGIVEEGRHGHRHRRRYRHGPRRGGIGNQLLGQILRRIR